MNEFSKNIDNIEVIKTRIFNQVHDIYKTHEEDKESIDFLLEFYIEDIDEEYHPEIFGITVEELKKLDYDEIIDLLILRRFGMYRKNNEIIYIIDLSFNPEVSDQLLVIHVDRAINIIDITNES